MRCAADPLLLAHPPASTLSLSRAPHVLTVIHGVSIPPLQPWPRHLGATPLSPQCIVHLSAGSLAQAPLAKCCGETTADVHKANNYSKPKGKWWD